MFSRKVLKREEIHVSLPSTRGLSFGECEPSFCMRKKVHCCVTVHFSQVWSELFRPIDEILEFFIFLDLIIENDGSRKNRANKIASRKVTFSRPILNVKLERSKNSHASKLTLQRWKLFQNVDFMILPQMCRWINKES